MFQSVGRRDESCEPKNVSTVQGTASKLHAVKNMNIEDGAGGGGGASFVFLVRHYFKTHIKVIKTHSQIFIGHF